MDDWRRHRLGGLSYTANYFRERRRESTALYNQEVEAANTKALLAQQKDASKTDKGKTIAQVATTGGTTLGGYVAPRLFKAIKASREASALQRESELGGRTEEEANYDEDLERTMDQISSGKRTFMDKVRGRMGSNEPEAPDEYIGESKFEGETGGQFRFGETTEPETTEPEAFDDPEEGENMWSLAKSFFNPTNPEEAAGQMTSKPLSALERSQYFDDLETQTNELASRIPAGKSGLFTVNEEGAVVRPDDPSMQDPFSRLYGNVKRAITGEKFKSQYSDESEAERFDGGGESLNETDPESKVEDWMGTETESDFGPPPKPPRIQSLRSRYSVEGAEIGEDTDAPRASVELDTAYQPAEGETAEEIGQNLARQQASTGDSTIARLMGESKEPDIPHIPSESSAGESTDFNDWMADFESRGYKYSGESSSAPETDASMVTAQSGSETEGGRITAPETESGDVSDFGAVSAPETAAETAGETAGEIAGETAGEVGAEVGADAAIEGLDVAAAAAAPIPGLDVVLGVVAGIATLAGAGYQIYDAVHNANKSPDPDATPQVVKQPAPQPGIAGKYVGASGENYYNQPTHFNAF